MEQQKRLYRSTEHRMIGGVCAGIAEYFDIDPTLIRAAFVLMAFGGGFGFLAYMILWVIIPEAATADQPIEVRAEAAGQQIQKTAEQFAAKVQQRGPASGRILVGAALVIIGSIALLDMVLPKNLVSWDRIWPLLLVVIGVLIIFRKK